MAARIGHFDLERDITIVANGSLIVEVLIGWKSKVSPDFPFGY